MRYTLTTTSTEVCLILFPPPERAGVLFSVFIFHSAGCSFSSSCYNHNAVAGEHSLNNKKGGLPPPPFSLVHHNNGFVVLGRNMPSRLIIRRDMPLASVSRIGIGGSAAWYVRVTTVDDLIGAMLWHNAHRTEYKNVPLMVVGDATNILFSDQTVPAFVIHNQASGIIPLDEHTLWVESGTSMNRVVAYCLKHSRRGLSWAGGLPGTVGGAVYGNAGAFGGQMDACVTGVVSCEKKNGHFVLRYRNARGCVFGYRTSIFKRNALRDAGSGGNRISRTSTFNGVGAAIIAVIFYAPRVDSIAVEKKAVADHRRYRRMHHPMAARTLGSTFQNVPVKNVPWLLRKQLADRIKRDPFPIIPAATLLCRAGCKNLHVGGASFSSQHANFIVALGKTSARDVKKLCQRASERVRDVCRVKLIPEIIFDEKFFLTPGRRKPEYGRK
ncbi:MAG: FAD-binding protein [Candidatus Paceibacterota bacterium]